MECCQRIIVYKALKIYVDFAMSSPYMIILEVYIHVMLLLSSISS